MRVVRGSTVTVLTDPFDGTPSAATAVATRANGTTISPAPAATVTGDRISVVLLAATHTASLDVLEVTVTATVGGVPAVQVLELDVVGSSYCTLAAVRLEPSLADPARYPDAMIANYRDDLEEYVEEAAGVAFVPRYGIERHHGHGHDELVLDTWEARALRLVLIDGVSVPLSEFELVGDRLRYTAGTFLEDELVEVHYEHGRDRPPGRIVRELVKALRRDLLSRNAQAPSELLWETVDGNTVRYSTPDYDAGRPTGVLGLDAAIAGFGRPRVSIG